MRFPTCFWLHHLLSSQEFLLSKDTELHQDLEEHDREQKITAMLQNKSWELLNNVVVVGFFLNSMFNWFSLPDIEMKIALMWLYQDIDCMTSDTIAWLSAFSSLFLGTKEVFLNIFYRFICFIMWFGGVFFLF